MQPKQFHPKRRKVKHDAHAPNQNEKDERSGNVLTDQLVEKQLKVLNADEDVELALSALTSSKLIRNFGDPHRALAGSEQVNEYLEADSGDVVNYFHQEGSVEEEKPAHRIGDIAAADLGAEPAPDHAQADAMTGKLAHAATFDIAASDNNVPSFRFSFGQHGGNDALVMLQVGIHNAKVRR